MEILRIVRGRRDHYSINKKIHLNLWHISNDICAIVFNYTYFMASHNKVC